jgi:hypothetical protein
MLQLEHVPPACDFADTDTVFVFIDARGFLIDVIGVDIASLLLNGDKENFVPEEC